MKTNLMNSNESTTPIIHLIKDGNTLCGVNPCTVNVTCQIKKTTCMKCSKQAYYNILNIYSQNYSKDNVSGMESTEPIEPIDIHDWFGLTYANYLVMPRTLLQSMPKEWQLRFVRMLMEFYLAFDHIEMAECYNVQAAEYRKLTDMTDEEIRFIGYDVNRGDPDLDEEDMFYDPNEREISVQDADLNAENVGWPVDDPVPHYNRGRTVISLLKGQKT